MDYKYDTNFIVCFINDVIENCYLSYNRYDKFKDINDDMFIEFKISEELFYKTFNNRINDDIKDNTKISFTNIQHPYTDKYLNFKYITHFTFMNYSTNGKDLIRVFPEENKYEYIIDKLNIKLYKHDFLVDKNNFNTDNAHLIDSIEIDITNELINFNKVKNNSVYYIYGENFIITLSKDIIHYHTGKPSYYIPFIIRLTDITLYSN